MSEKKKYRVTWEIIVDVEAENPDIATVLADEEWSKGNFNCEPYIEEIEQSNKNQVLQEKTDEKD